MSHESTHVVLSGDKYLPLPQVMQLFPIPLHLWQPSTVHEVQVPTLAKRVPNEPPGHSSAHVLLATVRYSSLPDELTPQVSQTPGPEHAAQSGTEHASHCRPVGPDPVPYDPFAHDTTHSVWDTARYMPSLHTSHVFEPDAPEHVSQLLTEHATHVRPVDPVPTPWNPEPHWEANTHDFLSALRCMLLPHDAHVVPGSTHAWQFETSHRLHLRPVLPEPVENTPGVPLHDASHDVASTERYLLLPQVTHERLASLHVTHSATVHASHVRPIAPAAPLGNKPEPHDATQVVPAGRRYLLLPHTSHLFCSEHVGQSETPQQNASLAVEEPATQPWPATHEAAELKLLNAQDPASSFGENLPDVHAGQEASSEVLEMPGTNP